MAVRDDNREAKTWHITCDCGEDLYRDVDTKRPSLLLGFLCSVCGNVTIGQINDKIKYDRNETLKINHHVLEIFQEMRPKLTIRQIYYSLTVRGVLPKTEQGYKQACYYLKKMRQSGAVPYGWLADSTRYRHKSASYNGLHAAMDEMHRCYRRNLWANTNAHVEIWVEKDALAGVIGPITNDYDVPLFVARGYSSETFIYNTAEEIKAEGKPAFIYHFGDYDPSGVDAACKIHEGLQRHGAMIEFKRAAITEDQINKYNLPTRPTKKKDPRSKNWGNRPSVELDSLPAPILRQLVEECILQHADQQQLSALRLIEEKERQTLRWIDESLDYIQSES